MIITEANYDAAVAAANHKQMLTAHQAVLQERDELKAQVMQSQAKLSLIINKLEDYCYMPDGIEESEIMRSLCLASPAQCLAEVKAQAIEDALHAWRLCNHNNVRANLKFYAEQLRQAAKD
ncbi:hypothetical protein [Alishewanella phage vB_AspM_Slickus01]|nr:hypothetical protein [Alishewanella phage vB_AspM_Slickus01]